MSDRSPLLAVRRPPKQVAVIALRRRDDDVEVCLIRRKDSRRWGIPKGFIDPGCTAEQASLIEAHEEAGLKGRVLGDAVGTYEYQKLGRGRLVAVYVMEVLEAEEHWREESFRERRWASLTEATTLLAEHPVRRVWDLIKPRLADSV